MIKTGKILAIGEPRPFTNKDGVEMKSYPVTISVPYVRQDGKKGEDVMICDHIVGNEAYLKQLEELMESQAELDMTISFTLRDYNGRLYTNIKLYRISKSIGV